MHVSRFHLPNTINSLLDIPSSSFTCIRIFGQVLPSPSPISSFPNTNISNNPNHNTKKNNNGFWIHFKGSKFYINTDLMDSDYCSTILLNHGIVDVYGDIIKRKNCNDYYNFIIDNHNDNDNDNSRQFNNHNSNNEIENNLDTLITNQKYHDSNNASHANNANNDIISNASHANNQDYSQYYYCQAKRIQSIPSLETLFIIEKIITHKLYSHSLFSSTINKH